MDASDFNLHFRAASPQIPTAFDTPADAHIVQSHESLMAQTVFDPSKTLNSILESIEDDSDVKKYWERTSA